MLPYKPHHKPNAVYMHLIYTSRWLPAAEGGSGRSTFGVSSPYSGKEIARYNTNSSSSSKLTHVLHVLTPELKR